MCITADNYAVLYHYRPCWIYKSVGFVFCLHQSFLKLCSISLTTLDMYVFHFYNVCDYIHNSALHTDKNKFMYCIIYYLLICISLIKNKWL